MSSKFQVAAERLFEARHGLTLEDWVSDCRAHDVGWRTIAETLYAFTRGEVDVTYETLRRWYPDREVAA